MAKNEKRALYEGFERRVYVVGFGLLVAFSVLILRLWQLQVVDWYDYRQMAEFNRLHPQRLPAPRGMIYGPDTSVVLADNRPSCDLVLVPAELRDTNVPDMCQRLENMLGIDGQALLEKITAEVRLDASGKICTDKLRDGGRQPYRQINVKQDVSKNDLTHIEESSFSLPGLYTIARPQRRYLQGKTAGQILGYMGEIGGEELEQNEHYEIGDRVGRGGLERMYENDMRGADGELVVNVYVSDRRPQLRTDVYGKPYVEIDSYGRKLREEPEFRIDPTPGKSIFTTLDIDLQRHCESILENIKVENNTTCGAIVVLNADSGAVLALASVPTYDPNVFVTYGRNKERVDALTAKPSQMTHRCYREAYAPGSVFKVMLAAAALEEGVIDENTTFGCPGYYQLEGVDRKWRCWNHYGHGGVNVIDALAYSCDVFFYNTGVRLGVDKIKEWSARLGLGVKSGIDLPQEVEGLIPSREWKEAELKKTYPDKPWEWKWYPGNTVNLSIGQGEAATTPLQNAVMMACIVNGGRHVRPFINKDLGPDVSEPFLSERTLRVVREGMKKCIEKENPPSGTGKAAKIPGMTIIGKTGSAQMVGVEQYKEYKKDEDIPYQLRDHAWFVCGVLDREPRIAMCVLVEHGHHGSSAAAPIAKQVLEYFYSPRSDSNEDSSVNVAKKEE
jgi:penicillin-binding protein 2